MNKRYLLFSCCDYYPMGGINDLKGCFTKKELLYILQNAFDSLDDYINIFDLKTMKAIRNVDEDDENYENFNFALDDEMFDEDEEDDLDKLMEIIRNND